MWHACGSAAFRAAHRPWAAWTLALSCALSAGCFYGSPPRVGVPYDTAVIPGCPNEADGSLSGCQKERAAWAAVLWERGQAASFITSGAAVHTPYVEAESLAAAMTALGVPQDRIYLDPHALHTDENMRNATRIARELGFSHVAVASHGAQAKGGCGMITSWGLLCTALPLDRPAARDKLKQGAAALAIAPMRRRADFRPLADVEADREKVTGHSRPKSAVLYPKMWLRRAFGAETPAPWLPLPPPQPAYLRFSEANYSDSAR